MDDLPTFYHGTRRGFTRGGYLFPRTFHQSQDGTSAPLRQGARAREDADRYVYVTTSKILAWVYAWHAPGRGKPKVLTVRTYGEIFKDPEHSEDMEAYRCDSAKVLEVDTEPMITEAEARAGWVEAS